MKNNIYFINGYKVKHTYAGIDQYTVYNADREIGTCWSIGTVAEWTETDAETVNNEMWEQRYDPKQPTQDVGNDAQPETMTDAENAVETAVNTEEETTMNENNEIRNALDENTAHCKHIAQDIERIASGGIYTCPECGEMVTMTETEDADGFTVYELSCGHTVEYEPDEMTFYEYFSDVYDIEYRVGSDREYRSVKLMVACGGPNIYIDTARRAVLLYWWTDRAEYPISAAAADEIDNVFSVIF